MKISRRSFLQLSALVTTLSVPSISFAKQNDLRTAKAVVGFPPGGGTDSIARLIADGIRGTYSENVMVLNKPGAAGRIAIDEVLRGPTDGSMFLVQPEGVMTHQPHSDPEITKFKFNDLQAVASFGSYNFALVVGPRVPTTVKTLDDYIAWCKVEAGNRTFATPGNNSQPEFFLTNALRSRGLEMTVVPYRGSSPGVSDLLAGVVPSMIAPIGDFAAGMQTGRLRAIATTKLTRSKFMPEVPTFHESGFSDMELTERMSVWVKSGVSKEQMEKLHRGVLETAVAPESKEFMEVNAIEFEPLSRTEYEKSVRANFLRWKRLRNSKVGFDT